MMSPKRNDKHFLKLDQGVMKDQTYFVIINKIDKTGRIASKIDLNVNESILVETGNENQAVYELNEYLRICQEDYDNPIIGI